MKNNYLWIACQKECSRFWLQGWRNVARDKRVDLFSVVTWPNKHSLPKFNPPLLNVVIFGGRNTPTTFQTKCKTLFFQNSFSNLPPSETETSLVEIRITRMSFLMGADSLHRQTKTFRNTLNPSEPKKTLVCFSRTRARASKQMHMCTLRERERERPDARELKTKIETKKKRKRDKFPNEREVAQAGSAQVPPRPRSFVRTKSFSFKSNLKINRAINQSINRNSVLPQCFSGSPTSSPPLDLDSDLPAKIKS